MPGARFFPGARLNFAENLLRHGNAHGDALVFWGEDKVKRRMSWRELADEVARTAHALREAGVGVGDRVAAILPNMPESIVGVLAPPSIGAVWSSCSPDFGVQGVLDRFGQIEPKVLIAVDGYYYDGKAHRHRRQAGCRSSPSCRRVERDDRRALSGRAADVAQGLNASLIHKGARAQTWDDAVHSRAAPPLHFERSAVLASAVRAVLLGHDGHAQVHRALGRRHAAEAPLRAPPARRHQGRATASSTSRRSAG